MKPIFISLSPNFEKDDLKLAFYLLLKPWQWRQFNQKEKELKEKIKNFLGLEKVFLFNSGRAGWLAILTALNLEKESEILIQGFTCNAVVNPIIWLGLKPVFVDIEEKTLNMDPEDLKKKITPKSKVVLVQHTFGKPADLETIVKICEKHNLFLIEDCAHCLGTYFQGRLVGTFGKAAFFSFGRDKLISSVFGGAVATNDNSLAQKIEEFQKKLNYPSFFWVFQQISHPILSEFLIKPLYSLNNSLGKLVLIFLQKIGILSKSVSDEEKQGGKPNFLFFRMPGPLIVLLLHQWQKLNRFNDHRQRISKIYEDSLKDISSIELPFQNEKQSYLRYPLLVSQENDTDKILEKARQEKIFLDDGWRKRAVVPSDTSQEKMGYFKNFCPVAEKVSQKIINLPTHINISIEDAKKIVKFLKKHLE